MSNLVISEYIRVCYNVCMCRTIQVHVYICVYHNECIEREIENGMCFIQVPIACASSGTTMTLVIWDLKAGKMYTASAGDSLSFRGNSAAETLELITADHASDSPTQQKILRSSIQRYFKDVTPQKKYARRGKIRVEWESTQLPPIQVSVHTCKGIGSIYMRIHIHANICGRVVVIGIGSSHYGG